MEVSDITKSCWHAKREKKNPEKQKYKPKEPNQTNQPPPQNQTKPNQTPPSNTKHKASTIKTTDFPMPSPLPLLYGKKLKKPSFNSRLPQNTIHIYETS